MVTNTTRGSNSGPAPEDRFNPVRLMVFLAAAGLLGYIVHRYAAPEDGDPYTDIPREVRLTYLPHTFETDIDLENALPILTNPYRYHREFDRLIHDFNLSLVDHVAIRMGLSDSLRTRVRSAYEQQHPQILRMMFNDFVSLQDTSAALYNTWYQQELGQAVDLLNLVASKYTCFFVQQALAAVLPTLEGKIFIQGTDVETPCGVALQEGLRPTVERLKKRAAVADFSRAKGLLQERAEKTIAELATMEVRDRKGIGSSRKTTLLGIDVSSTELEITAISLLKVGFRMDRSLNMAFDEQSGVVTLTLPPPQVLSHEVYPRVDKLDIGWLRELEKDDFNEHIDLLRQEFRREALSSDVIPQAKQKAVSLMETLLVPVIRSMDPRYSLVVVFQEPLPLPDAPFPDSPALRN